MIRIGLTGGIGAGKSSVARVLADLGGVIIDADRIAREVVEPGTPGLEQLVSEFGDRILADDGALDRPALAAIAFSDDEHRERLNSIVHPLVGARTAELAALAGEDAIVVHDIPLIVENHMAPAFHLVVVVGADEQTRIDRLVRLRGMDVHDATSRIAAQATDEQRRAVADVWLDNAGVREETAEATARLWHERLVPFERNVRNRRRASYPVELVESNPDWMAAGERLTNRLRSLCGGSAIRVDHIGSTAVPGLVAKPVLDVQITVTDIGIADSLSDTLADGGFPRAPEINHDNAKPDPVTGMIDRDDWHKRFHGSADPGRIANIHLRVDGSPGQRFALAFRDRLRGEPALRDEYAAMKKRALSQSGGDIGGYLAIKEPWFDSVYPATMR